MSMAFLSICLCFLQFISSVSYSFPSTGFSLRQNYFQIFILSEVIISEIISLSSYSLLLVYRHAADFYRFSICNFTKFIVLIVFWWHFQDFLQIVLCHFQTVTILFIYFHFGFLYLFIFLIAVARSSNTTMSKSAENGHPTLVLDLRDIFSVFYCEL